ncbi:MAG: winged helix-turn-helix domain-containing protein [Actinomycetota bacterium]|nr:winged helix-turn-helix domain-containing protein [Actinomycetota bacterium]
MSTLKKRLESSVARPIGSPEDAEKAARAAEALAEYLRAEKLAEAALAPERPGQAAGPLAELTLQDAAERVLDAAGIPLHVKELGRKIKAGGWSHPRSKRARPDQINFQLAARLPRHPDRFVRVAPNTFGLLSWATGSERPRPRLAVFKGPQDGAARRSGDLADEAAASPWRSS